MNYDSGNWTVLFIGKTKLVVNQSKSCRSFYSIPTVWWNKCFKPQKHTTYWLSYPLNFFFEGGGGWSLITVSVSAKLFGKYYCNGEWVKNDISHIVW